MNLVNICKVSFCFVIFFCFDSFVFGSILLYEKIVVQISNRDFRVRLAEHSTWCFSLVNQLTMLLDFVDFHSGRK